MPYTYPPSGPTLSGDAVTIHRMLANPTLVARRLRTLLEQRYIADAILKGRFQVFGGAIAYETGEPIGTAENPRAVAPGAEYPLVKASRTAPCRSRAPPSGDRTRRSPTRRSSDSCAAPSTGRLAGWPTSR